MREPWIPRQELHTDDVLVCPACGWKDEDLSEYDHRGRAMEITCECGAILSVCFDYTTHVSAHVISAGSTENPKP